MLRICSTEFRRREIKYLTKIDLTYKILFMKKALLIILLLMVFQLPSNSANKKMIPATGSTSTHEALPNIFIYSIPDDNDFQGTADDTDAPESTYVNDTQSSTENTDEEILLNMKQDPSSETTDSSEDYNENITFGATVLKGYAQYVEDSNSIYLKDDNDDFVLNLKAPQKILASKGLNLNDKTASKTILRYADDEYHIAPKSIKATDKIGNFTMGAVYGNEVDNIAMLETETGLFTKYEKSRFAVSSSVKKSLNTTYAKDYNTISITPEFKLNSYISLKSTLKADVTRNRRSSELTFSLNPFGEKDTDKLLLEAGAKQTYFVDTGDNKTQLNFSAIFKL